MSIVFIIASFILGYVIAAVRFKIALIKNPEQFAEMVKNAPRFQNDGACPVKEFYVEKADGKYFAYSVQKNIFEGMADSYDDLVEILRDKYPSYDITVSHFE